MEALLKKITSKHKMIKLQIKNFLISWKNHVHETFNFLILNHSINFKCYDVVISISARDRVHF